MRKFLIPLLMASVAIPASASAMDEGFASAMRNRGEQMQRDRSGDDRPQHAERPQRSQEVRSERPQRAERSARPVRQQQADNDVQVAPQAAPSQPVQVTRTEDGRRDVRRPTMVDGFIKAVEESRDGTRDRVRKERREGERRWANDWRRDSRYNWYSYRNRYGSLYRLGRYYDPYGYGYRRFSIGFSMWPSYYQSSYWLNDPWMYRLPPAYGPYRWVRYYDDALLVNIYDGEVVDVIYNFFW